MNGTLKAKEAYEALDAMMALAAQYTRTEFLGEETLVDCVQRVRDAFAADHVQAKEAVDRWLREQLAGVREVVPVDPRYPYDDCCPNVPATTDSFLPCDDGYCCEHEVWHGSCGNPACEIHRPAETEGTSQS